MSPILAASLASAQPSLNITSLPTYPGTTVQLPLQLRNGSNVSAVQFDVAYSPVRAGVTQPRLAERFTNHVIRSREISPGRHRVLVYSLASTEAVSNRTSVLRLPVSLPPQEYTGSGPLRLQSVVLSDGAGTVLAPVSTANGEVYASRVQRRGDGIVDFFLPSQPEERYLIQATTNLLDWVNLSTNVALGTFMDLVDFDGRFYDHRFYRSLPFDTAARGLISGFERRADGTTSFRFLGLEGGRYVVEVSADLERWTALTTNLVTSRSLNFIDPDAPGYSQRFYRLRRD